jgi:hypothetical protein
MWSSTFHLLFQKQKVVGFFGFFNSYGGLHSGPHAARQVLYHLSLTPRPFCSNYFPGRISRFLPRPAWTERSYYLMPSASCKLGSQLFTSAYLLKSPLTNFLPGLALNCIPSYPFCIIAGITDMSHYTLLDCSLYFCFFPLRK